jgi:hypothetical protein
MKLSKRLASKRTILTRRGHSATRRRVLSLEQMEDRRLLAQIPIPNAGFEVRGTTNHPNDSVILQGTHDYPRPEIESWRYFEAGGNGGPARIVYPATGFIATAAEGNHVVRVVTDPRPWVLTIGPTAGVAQILNETFDSTMTYDLTAQVSRYTDNTSEPDDNWNGYVVQLAVGGVNHTPGGQFSGQVIGGTVIAEDWNTQSVPFGTWVTSTVQYTPDPSDAALDGQPLQVRLLAIRDPDDPAIENPPDPPVSNADFSYVKYAAFDDVQLFEEEAGADTTPPVVTGVELNAGFTDPDDLPNSGGQPTSWELQRSGIFNMELQFSESVTLDVDDLRLTNLGMDAPNDDDVVFDLQPNHFNLVDDVVTLSFAPGELDDGVYRIEVLQTATDLAGNPLDGANQGVASDYILEGNTTNKFHQLEADWNGDAGISVFDFTSYSYWFGTSIVEAPFGPQYVDINNDDGISVFDFTGYSEKFGAEVVYANAFAGRVLLGPAEENLATDVQIAIEQVVEEIPVTALQWGVVTRRSSVDELELQQRVRSEEQDIELVIDALTNDIADAWA